MKENIIGCKCMNIVAIRNLRLGMQTAISTYNDTISRIEKFEPQSMAIVSLHDQSVAFRKFLKELDDMPIC